MLLWEKKKKEFLKGAICWHTAWEWWWALGDKNLAIPILLTLETFCISFTTIPMCEGVLPLVCALSTSKKATTEGLLNVNLNIIQVPPSENLNISKPTQTPLHTIFHILPAPTLSSYSSYGQFLGTLINFPSQTPCPICFLACRFSLS